MSVKPLPFHTLKASEDVVTNTQLYGIYNPKNLHSFQPTLSIFVPAHCAACQQTVYPFMEACICLRCEIYSHRKCCQRQADCSMFTFRSGSRSELAANGSVSIQRTGSTAPDAASTAAEIQDYSSAYVAKLNDFVHRASMIPAVLGQIPEPRSQFCVWKSILRAVAMNQEALQELSLDADAELDDVEIQISKELSNPDSFLAQVAHVCVYVFVGLNFETVDSMLTHARECVDTVLCAALSLCKDPLTGNQRVMTVLVTSIDRFMLTLYDGAMYSKIMTDIKRRTPVALPSSNPERVKTQLFPENWRAKTVIYSTKLANARAPADKLFHLIKLLQYISKLAAAGEPSPSPSRKSKKSKQPASAVCEDQEPARYIGEGALVGESFVQVGPGSLLRVLEGSAPPIDAPFSSPAMSCVHSPAKGVHHAAANEVICIDDAEDSDNDEDLEADFSDELLEPAEQSGWITYNRNVAAVFEGDDMLTPRRPTRDDLKSEDDVVLVEVQPEKTADTDRLLQVLAYVLYIQQKEGVVDWVAECRFLSSEMTNQDSPIMSGPHGYALVTLQQALYCLVQGEYDCEG